MWNHFASEVDRAEKIKVHSLSPFFEAGGKEPFRRRASGISDTNVYAAKFRNYSIDKAAYLLCVRYIQSLWENLGALLFLELQRGRRQGLRVTAAHRYPASLGGEGLGCSPSNPLAGSGHDRDPIFQTCIHRDGIIKVLAGCIGWIVAFCASCRLCL